MSNPDLYRTYVTQTGFGLEAAAKAAGAGVFDGSVWFVIGDKALDEATNPQTMTDLNNQVRSYPATIEQDNDDPTIWIARVEIPADDGGFFIREAGIRVDDRDTGDLYCYARQAGDYKPELTEGQGKSYTIRLKFIPGNAEVINAKIDPSVQFATPTDLNNAIKAHEEAVDPHPIYATKEQVSLIKEGFSSGQTWHNDRQMPDRMFNVRYTNINDFPIQVQISFESMSDLGAAAQFLVDDESYPLGYYYASGGGYNINLIIQPGSEYWLSASSSNYFFT